MCIYGIVKIGTYSYNKELYTYKVHLVFFLIPPKHEQRLENPKTSIVYCSAPTHIYICNTLPLDNFKIHLHLAQPYITLFSVSMLSSHKIYKEKGGKHDFLQFIHDIVLCLVENSPQLTGVAKKNDNFVRLTGRHFPSQSLYQGEAKKRKHNPKMCRVCYAKGKRTEVGHIIKSTQYCEECPEKPGLCLGECS